MIKKNNYYFITGIFFIFIIGAFYRFTATYPPNLRYDPASTALQAFQILDGYRPIFWPGQAFMSALGSYIIAFLFKVFPPSIFMLNLLGYSLTIIFTALSILAAYKLFNIRTAFLTALFFMIPTNAMMYWSSQARPDYEICFILVPIILIITNSINTAYQNNKNISVKSMLLGFISGVGMWNNMAIAPLLIVTFFLLLITLRKFSFKAFLPYYTISFIIGFLPVIYFNITNGFIILGQGSFNNISNLSIVMKNFITNAYPYFLGVKYKVFEGAITRCFLNFFLLWIFILYVTFFIQIIFKIKRKEKVFPFLLTFSYLLAHLIVSATSNFGNRFAKISHPTLYISTLYAIAFTIPAYVISSIKNLKTKIIISLPILIYFSANIYDTTIYVKNFSEAMLVNGIKDTVKLPEKDDSFITFEKNNNTEGGYYLGRNKMMQSVKSANKVVFSDFYKEMYIPYALKVDSGKNIFWANHGGLEKFLEPLNCKFEQSFIITPKIIYKNQKKELHNESTLIFYNFNKILYKESLINNYKFHSSSSIPSDFFINDNRIDTLWRLNNNEKKQYFEITFDEPENISKIVLIPKNEATCPQNYTISYSHDGNNYNSLYNISGGTPIFWSSYHPFIKIIKPRIEINFPELNKLKTIRFDFADTTNHESTSISEILVFKKTTNEKIDKTDYNSDIENLINAIKANHNDAIIYSDHWLQNRLKKDGLNTEFISNFTINNTGKKNPHYRKWIPINLNQKTVVISNKSEINCIKNTLDENNITYEIFSFKYHDFIEIKKIPEKYQSLYWNGLTINKISTINDFVSLKNYFENIKELNINFANRIKLLNFKINYNEEKKQYSLFFEWLPLSQIEKGYYLFIHFINEKEEIIFQSDMKLKPSFSDDWTIGKTEICEQYVTKSNSENLKLRLRIGIWNPETGKRFKNDIDGLNQIIIDIP